MDFTQPTFMQKRKRSHDDDEISDEETDHRFKQRKAVTSLPIRIWSKPAGDFGFACTPFGPPPPLTPVDTSEDESLGDDPNEPIGDDPFKDLSQGSSRSRLSTSSLTVNLDYPQYTTDVGMMMSPPPRPRYGRARSNDLVSPAQLMTTPPLFLAPQQPNPLSDRIPTPIASHFTNNFDAAMNTPSAPRHSFPPSRNFLSPMMEQDAWGTPNDPGLLSPAVEHTQYNHTLSADVMMGYEQTSNGMSTLRVSVDDEDQMMDDDNTPNSLASAQIDGHHRAAQQQSQHHTRQLSQGKTPRLHMGPLAGCMKCEQKVPGHYSHIIRPSTPPYSL